MEPGTLQTYNTLISVRMGILFLDEMKATVFRRGTSMLIINSSVSGLTGGFRYGPLH